MKILFATFSSPESFLESLEIGEQGITTLQVTTKARYEPDEKVILEIGYPGLPNRILLRAEAAEAAEAAAEPGDRAATTEQRRFRLNQEEEPQRDFLIAVASGRANVAWKRRHRRFPMRMPARVSLEGESQDLLEAETEDMATGGLSLKTSQELPDGARVTVMLEPGDGTGAIEFSGRVVWNRKDDDSVEVGVQFDSPGGESMRRLRQMIRGVKVSGETLE